MTPCNIFGCVIDDENRYSASSRAKKWNFTAVVVVVGHVIHPTHLPYSSLVPRYELVPSSYL